MTQVYSVITARAREARLIAGTRDPIHRRGREFRALTTKEMGIARKMARDVNCRIDDIARAISWKLSKESLRKKLAAVNIRCVGGSGKLFLHLRKYESRR